MFPNGSSHRQFPNNRRDGGGFGRPPPEDNEGKPRFADETQRDGSMNNKLDRLLERFDKFDVWREETDRKFENLDPTLFRETEPPLGFDDGDDWDDDGLREKKPWEKGFSGRNPTLGFREGPPRDRNRRDGRGRPGSCWDAPGSRISRTRYDQQFDKPASCWDPPQRFQSHMDAYEKPQRVKMHAPRFDGSDAMNWVSRVNYYFDHLMMPDAQRLHYAVMLFDPPASEWVFNYCANNDFVTWQDFLEDVRHRFDRQSFKDYFGLIAKLTQTGFVEDYHDTFEKYLNRIHGIPERELFILFIAGLKSDMHKRLRLHRPSSLAEAMALSLELASTQPDRTQVVRSSRLRFWRIFGQYSAYQRECRLSGLLIIAFTCYRAHAQ